MAKYIIYDKARQMYTDLVKVLFKEIERFETIDAETKADLQAECAEMVNDFDNLPTIEIGCENCKHKSDEWDSENCDGCTRADSNYEPCEDAISMPKGWCGNCRRSSDYCCKTDEDRTRCPIEEHYVLPKYGFCHLYEAIDCGVRK